MGNGSKLLSGELKVRVLSFANKRLSRINGAKQKFLQVTFQVINKVAADHRSRLLIRVQGRNLKIQFRFKVPNPNAFPG